MNKTGKTVFIVDDDASFLKGINRLLRRNGYVTECFSAAGDFLERRPNEGRGCVLVDLHMPEMDGLTLQQSLAKDPNPLPIVFLTGHATIPSSVEAVRNGAEDFLLKTAPKEQVIAAIERALARDAEESGIRAHYMQLQSRFDMLTPREKLVLSHVMLGQRNKKIAAELGIDERSVKRHRTNLMRKLDVTSVPELIRLTIESGVTASNEPF